MENKTTFIGDNSKVAALVNEMPWPEGLEKTGIELQTGSRPYELTVNFLLNNYTGVRDENIGAITRNAFFSNSVLLLSLIDNADQINYTLYDHTGQYDGAFYSFSFSREEIDKLLDGDIREYAADEAELRLLIDRMSGIAESL